MAGQPVPARRMNPLALQAEIADLLIVQNRLLGEIRDRLPESTPTTPAGPDPDEPVEVREPAPKLAPGRKADPDPEAEPVPVAEPAPAKKATPRKAGRRRT